MDDDRVPQPMRGILQDALAETQRRGAAAIGPEHLLLALALDADAPTGRLLAEFGLDHQTVERALDEERARSLAVVGIADIPDDLLDATRRETRPGWASSTREVFRRVQPSGGRGRRRHGMELDLLSGIITAPVGTVPRALVYAGVDRDALIGRVARERRAVDEMAPRGTPTQERQAMHREAMRRAHESRNEAMRRAHETRNEAMRDAQRARTEAMRDRRDAKRDDQDRP